LKDQRLEEASRGRLPRKAALGLALAALACANAPEPPPSIVLLVVDTLRADRLGHAGYAGARTPAWDALARESVSFDQARSTSAWTLPSTASLFLSQRVSEHGAAGWHARLPEGRASLAQALAGAGYRTGMWTANRVIAGGRGLFEHFDHAELVTHPEHEAGVPLDERAFGPGAVVTRRALDWIQDHQREHAGRPFLAYLHTMEPHAPYLCGPGAGPRCPKRALALNRRLLEMRWDLPEGQRALLSRLYDADVVRMDGVLAQLRAGLEAAGLLDRIWLVVVSDHGELLGEDGLYMHGRSLTDALVHVPLLFRGPGLAPARVATPVSILDVAPTLLDLAGVPPPGSFRGRSLRPALEGRSLPDRPVVAELFREGDAVDPRQRHVLAVVDGQQKYLVRTDGAVERYDLARDPGERQPLPAPEPRFSALLDEIGLSADPARYLGAPATEPTPETLEALRNLGYLAPEAPEAGAP
jgi:arylsulfatase A-like enzyme